MIVYVWPRIHQNICDELSFLTKNKIPFKVFCLKQSRNDETFFVRLIEHNKIFTRLATMLLGNMPNNGCAIPRLSNIFDLRKSIKNADIVCLREGRFPVTLLSLYFSYVYEKSVHFRVQVKDLNKLKNIMTVRAFFLRKGITFKLRNNLPIVNDAVSFQPFIVGIGALSGPRTINRKHLKITSVGKLENRKNLHISILLGGFIASKYPQFSVTIEIVYSWKNQDSSIILEKLYALKKKCEIENLNLKINFYAEISNDKVRELMSQSAVYLHPADDEPASYSIVEAYAKGCFVICKSDCLTSKYLGQSDHATIKTIDATTIFSVFESKINIIFDRELRAERMSKIITICNKNPLKEFYSK